MRFFLNRYDDLGVLRKNRRDIRFLSRETRGDKLFDIWAFNSSDCKAGTADIRDGVNDEISTAFLE